MLRTLRIAGATLALGGLLVAAGLPAFAEEKLTGVVNINTASAEQLELLPGIGAARAQAVIAARQARGGFQAVDDLLAVKGIGEASLSRLRPHLVVKGETTARLE